MKQEISARQKHLTRGKVKAPGALEILRLRRLGRQDGIQGLPRQDGEGNWSSPFVSREQNSCEEFCSHMWAMLQLEHEGDFARLNELTAVIPMAGDRIRTLQQELAPIPEESPFPPRKRGEEELTEDQVRARRAREREKELAPRKEALAQLEAQLRAETEELISLFSRLEQDGNTVRIYLHRVREHSRQRLDIYWNAALRCHPEGDALPPVPEIIPSTRAEEAYWALHRHLAEKAAALIPGRKETA